MDHAEDRLSALSDDLLRLILHFVPSKEAASTSVLSRRWGSLWRSTGAVDLSVRVPDLRHSSGYSHGDYRKERQEADDAFFSCQQAFSRAAEAALAAAEAPVTRLALRVDTDGDDADLERFIHSARDDGHWSEHVVGAVLSHRAARHVEELRVALVSDDATRFPGTEIRASLGICCPAASSLLPSPEILRVLDLTGCGLPPAAFFPRLATLRLRFCSIQTTDLQALIDAAPDLTDVHLQSVLFTIGFNNFLRYHIPEYEYTNEEEEEDDTEFDGSTTTTVAMSLPAVTTLVLALCGLEIHGVAQGNSSWAMAIDAPRLRSFVYKGLLRQFQLRSSAPELARADLHFLKDRYNDGDDKERTRMLFWQFVQSFSSAKVLKLKVHDGLKEIAAIGKARRAQHLRPLPNVERLELDGWYHPASTTASVAIANLLHCCPALGDLTLKLSTVPPDSNKSRRYAEAFLERKDRVDYTRSIDRFRRRSSTIPMDMEDSNDVRYRDVHDIPGLSGHSFACLQTNLRRVSMQFRLGDSSSSSCLGLRLVKFFAENAMVLEEMRIDTGNQRLYEHLNLSNTTKACSEQENLAAEGQCEFSRNPSVSIDSISTTDLGRRGSIGFTVLPHHRRTRIDIK